MFAYSPISLVSVCIFVKCLSLIFQMLLKDVRAALFWDGTEK